LRKLGDTKGWVTYSVSSCREALSNVYQGFKFLNPILNPPNLSNEWLYLRKWSKENLDTNRYFDSIQKKTSQSRRTKIKSDRSTSCNNSIVVRTQITSTCIAASRLLLCEWKKSPFPF